MEVSLVSKRGVPEDAIISIRSGAVRRQGAIASEKPFRFPQGASEADCVVKVDIMQTIGSGYLVMRPNQTESKQYEVVMTNNPDISCDIVVQPLEGSATAPGPSAQDEAAAVKTKMDAKAYLESTGLLPFVQGVLQVVAKQQPQDPFAAMAKHFLSASDEAEPPKDSKVGSPKAAPASPKCFEAAAAEEAAEAKPESPKAGGEKGVVSGNAELQAAEITTTPGSALAEMEVLEGLARGRVESLEAMPPAEEAAEAKPEEAAAEAKEAAPPAAAEEATKAEPPETNAAPPPAAEGEEAKASEEKAEVAAEPPGEAAAPPAKEEEKAESDHVQDEDYKSDTLEEFTSKVTDTPHSVEEAVAKRDKAKAAMEELREQDSELDKQVAEAVTLAAEGEGQAEPAAAEEASKPEEAPATEEQQAVEEAEPAAAEEAAKPEEAPATEEQQAVVEEEQAPAPAA